MQAGNARNLAENIQDWMRSKRLEKGSQVTVAEVLQGLGPVPRHTWETVKAELDAMVGRGELAVFIGKYQLTEVGELSLYPGTSQDNVDLVKADLQNYMFQNAPDTSFQLQQYQSEISQRLNPRQAAASIVNQAIQELVADDYWAPSGRDAYTLCE